MLNTRKEVHLLKYEKGEMLKSQLRFTDIFEDVDNTEKATTCLVELYYFEKSQRLSRPCIFTWRIFTCKCRRGNLLLP